MLVFDLIVNILLPEKFKKTIGTTRNYSLKSIRFHHKTAPNINLYEHWGKRKYKVTTNELAMRVKNNEDYNLKNLKENIAFIGDSFVYGSGIEYKDHWLILCPCSSVRNSSLLLWASNFSGAYFLCSM